ncbi:unnamed protein product, partial [Symbiodinium pilosum]
VPKLVLKPGSTVALHCSSRNRFVRMNSDLKVDGTHRDFDDLPVDWSWERFTVVDGGSGQIALHNAKWNRFVVMDADGLRASSGKAASELPKEWTWERFTVVDAGNGEIALHNAAHNRFIDMSPEGDVKCSAPADVQNLAAGPGMRFRVFE